MKNNDIIIIAAYATVIEVVIEILKVFNIL